jgi:hypothetical protein
MGSLTNKEKSQAASSKVGKKFLNYVIFQFPMLKKLFVIVLNRRFELV